MGNKIIGAHYRCPDCGSAFIENLAEFSSIVNRAFTCAEDGHPMIRQWIYEDCKIEKTYSTLSGIKEE